MVEFVGGKFKEFIVLFQKGGIGEMLERLKYKGSKVMKK